MAEVNPLFFSKALQYYKRREVQEAILRHAQDREISPRYGEGFGKRPDILSYPNDVLEFAKKKTTSFHASEERWGNPLHIKTGASRKEMNELRTGWDLVLDIDAKNWEISRLTAWLFVESLKVHGIKHVSAKFSGNKGWHIGVSWEAFPTSICDSNGKDTPTKDLFPELPRAIAGYLLDFMSRTENGLISIEENGVTFGWNNHRKENLALSTTRKSYTFSVFGEMAGKTPESLFFTFCPKCNRAVDAKKELYQLSCGSQACLFRHEKKFTREDCANVDDRERICPKCKRLMEFSILAKKGCVHDPREYERRFKLDEVIQVDTVLLASRHLYRMAYSLHEKSGLVSVVIDPEGILGFDKAQADPKIITFDRTFLDQHVERNEAATLVTKALEWQQKNEQQQSAQRSTVEFEEVTEAVSEEHFPPCIKKILSGMVDGKKRAMFALTNFFLVCGWTTDMIEKRLHEWNELNGKVGEPLREVIIKGHMHQVRMKKERILPPNCIAFYQELGVCTPDEFCSRVKNPATYGIKHSRLGEKPKRARSVPAPQASTGS